MKVKLYMAITTNGIIARETGEEDFLSDLNWECFRKLAEEIGCFIIGRKTYDAVKKWKDFSFDEIKAKKIVVSQKALEIQGYLPVKSPKEAIEKAKSEGFETVLLTGGSELNSSFMRERLVNEIILNVEPVVLGRGIRLFAEADFEAKLKLIDVKKLEDGIIQLYYGVEK